MTRSVIGTIISDTSYDNRDINEVQQARPVQFVEKPAVSASLPFFAFLVPRNRKKSQGVGYAGKARLAHVIVFKTFLTL